MSIVAQQTTQGGSAEFSADWVRCCVQQKTHGQVRNLTVFVESGVVYLEGVCTRYYPKQLASQAALQACAVLDAGAALQVQNSIEVC